RVAEAREHDAHHIFRACQEVLPLRDLEGVDECGGHVRLIFQQLARLAIASSVRVAQDRVERFAVQPVERGNRGMCSVGTVEMTCCGQVTGGDECHPACV